MTAAALARATPLGPDQRQLVVRLDELAGLGLRVEHEVQRPVDPQRVDEIVAYQRARLARTGSLLLLGELVACTCWGGDGASDWGGDATLWLVDGQHRYCAALLLAPLAPAYCVSVAFVRRSAALPISEVFRLLNMSVPVPQYLVEGTLLAAQRRLLQRFGEQFRSRHGPFVSSARRPRRPNVNLGDLQDRLAEAEGGRLLEAIEGPEQLQRFVSWANDGLREVDAEVRERADARAGPAARPLYLRADEGMAWATLAGLQAFWRGMPYVHAAKGAGTPSPGAKAPANQALRWAVWNAAFGADVAVGACACCGRAIGVQSFEAGHVVARARGGVDSVANMRPVCGPCNRSMGTRDMDEFAAAHFAPRHEAVTPRSAA